MTDKNHKYHVAISFSDENSFIAKDIYHYLTELGLTIFNYKIDPDRAGGNLQNKIEEIYSKSSLNLIIWSKEYSEKKFDAIVTKELQVIMDRHIKNNEYDSLFILATDKTEIHNPFRDITRHELKTVGLFETRNFVVKRLVNLCSLEVKSENNKMYHPRSEVFKRSTMQLCKFKILNNYKTKRWDTLGDIKVEVIKSNSKIDDNLDVYLIPSGRVTTLLTHSMILKTQKINLKIKQDLSEKFIRENLNIEFTGFLFYIFHEEREYPHIYSFNFDDKLNEGLMNLK